MRKLRETLARRILGRISPLDLPAVATEALVEGIDSPSLRVLAGLDIGPALGGERDEYFQKTCSELGLHFADRKEAAVYLRELYLDDIRSGRVSPEEGCHKIVWEVYYSVHDLFEGGGFVGEAFGIAELVGIYWSYDDLEDRPGAETLHMAVLEFARKSERKEANQAPEPRPLKRHGAP